MEQREQSQESILLTEDIHTISSWDSHHKFGEKDLQVMHSSRHPILKFVQRGGRDPDTYEYALLGEAHFAPHERCRGEFWVLVAPNFYQSRPLGGHFTYRAVPKDSGSGRRISQLLGQQEYQATEVDPTEERRRFFRKLFLDE